jgi:hypothetical protein
VLSIPDVKLKLADDDAVCVAICVRLPREVIEPKAVISFTDLLFNFTILISFLLFHRV